MPQQTNTGELSSLLSEKRQVRRSLETYLYTDVGSREQQQALNEPYFFVMGKEDKVPWIPFGFVAPPMPTRYRHGDVERFASNLVSPLPAMDQLVKAYHAYQKSLRAADEVQVWSIDHIGDHQVHHSTLLGYISRFLSRHGSTEVLRSWLSINHGLGDDLITEGSEDPAPPVETPTLTGRPTGPVQFFENLLEAWGLDEEAGAKLLGFEGTIELSDLLSGTVSLRGRDTKDRLRHLLEIGFALDSLFRNENSVRMWLREPLGELGDESPLDHLREGSMEHLLRLRQLVEFLSGR